MCGKVGGGSWGAMGKGWGDQGGRGRVGMRGKDGGGRRRGGVG